MRFFHRRTEPWEVVDCKAIEPVPTYSEDELEDMQIMRVSSAMIHRTYLFELKNTSDLQKAALFARQRLLQEAVDKGYNVFLTEGWTVSRLRNGKRQRVEVRYTACPANAVMKASRTPVPPFLAMLKERDCS